MALRVAPWLVAGTVVVLLARRYSFEEIRQQLGQGDPWSMVPIAGAMSLAALLLMAWADALLFSAVLAPIGLRALAAGRAGLSILLAVSYSVSTGGFGLWLARRTGARASAAVGALGLQMMSDMCAL